MTGFLNTPQPLMPAMSFAPIAQNGSNEQQPQYTPYGTNNCFSSGENKEAIIENTTFHIHISFLFQFIYFSSNEQHSFLLVVCSLLNAHCSVLLETNKYLNKFILFGKSSRNI